MEDESVDPCEAALWRPPGAHSLALRPVDAGVSDAENCGDLGIEPDGSAGCLEIARLEFAAELRDPACLVANVGG